MVGKMFFGKKKVKNKKYGKATNVFKKSKTKGYIQVHMMYLMDELSWIRKNTTQVNVSSGNSSVVMVENLVAWMAMREKPKFMFWVAEKEWKNWVTLREDHWLIDHTKRAELIKQKQI